MTEELSRHERKEIEREEKERLRNEKSASSGKKNTMKKTIRYSLSLIVFLIIIFSGYSYLKKKENEPGMYDNFAKCLTERGVIMAGAFWCPHCADQKKLFGKSFKYVTYKECDPKGNDADPAFCLENEIKSYPTWIIKDQKYSGEQSLEKLSELSECELK